MLNLKRRQFPAVILLTIVLSSLPWVFAADTGTISDIDIDQTKKELSWYGITGIQISISVDIDFTVQVGEANPNIFFEASITQSGSSYQLSESGHQNKIVTNNTQSTIGFDMVPLTITATGKSSENSEISLKKGDKMIFSVEMYYYASGEITKTTLATETKTFYLLSSPPTNWIFLVILIGVFLIGLIVVVWIIIWQRKLLD